MIETPVPHQVYLDTSLVTAAIIAGIPHSVASAEFCRRLAVEGRPVFFSQILRLEITQAFMNLVNRPGQLPADIQEEFGLAAWNENFLVREGWLRFCIAQLEDFLGQFEEVFELPFTPSIWRRSVGIMALDRLRSHDAIHVATAREYGIISFVTGDDHFLRISDLEVLLIRDDPQRLI